jgi:hypothetical protein
MGPATTVSVNSRVAAVYAAAAGSVSSVPAATYKVGLCGQNTGSNDINRNVHTSGFVFVGS